MSLGDKAFASLDLASEEQSNAGQSKKAKKTKVRIDTSSTNSFEAVPMDEAASLVRVTTSTWLTIKAPKTQPLTMRFDFVSVWKDTGEQGGWKFVMFMDDLT